MGISQKSAGNRVIYAMRVEEILTYAEYFRDRRFAAKIPDCRKAEIVCKCGDNIYKPLPNGELQQLQSKHSCGTEENPKLKISDLGGKYVLVSRTFYYFGSKAIHLPGRLEELKVGKGHKNRFSQGIVSLSANIDETLTPLEFSE